MGVCERQVGRTGAREGVVRKGKREERVGWRAMCVMQAQNESKREGEERERKREEERGGERARERARGGREERAREGEREREREEGMRERARAKKREGETGTRACKCACPCVCLPSCGQPSRPTFAPLSWPHPRPPTAAAATGRLFARIARPCSAALHARKPKTSASLQGRGRPLPAGARDSPARSRVVSNDDGGGAR